MQSSAECREGVAEHLGFVLWLQACGEQGETLKNLSYSSKERFRARFHLWHEALRRLKRREMLKIASWFSM